MTRVSKALAAATLATAATTTMAAQNVQINGAGATFPAPIYTKWFAEYNKMHPEVRINYQPLGSGAGIRQITERTVFFGASDGPMTNEQLQAVAGKILHLPTVLGAVVPIYNIPGVSQELKFSGPVLANIYLGKITKWNDEAITKLNPGVNLPATDVVVAHRSDGSGTTYIWVDYLSKVSPEFKKAVGVGTAVKWPTGLAAAKNDGVAAIVSQTPGAIGYVELIYALQTKASYGQVQNMSGKFVKASLESVSAAADAAAKQMPADYRVSITNAPGDTVYPVSSFTWMLFYQDPKDKAQGKLMVDFMKWALTDGQKFAGEMGYAPLPKNVVDMEMKTLATIKVQ
jgi:phosphate transport system substrate-binding protein